MDIDVWTVSAARSPGPAAQVSCSLLCGVVAAGAIAGPAAGARRPSGDERQDVPKPVERLWSEYPLNPSAPRSQQPRTPLEPRPIDVGGARPREAAEGGGGISGELLFAATVAALGLLALAVFALRHGGFATAAGTSRLGLRSRLALPALPLPHASTRGLNHSPNDGGHRMSYFRRTRNSDDENEGNAQRSADSEQTSIEKLAA